MAFLEGESTTNELLRILKFTERVIQTEKAAALILSEGGKPFEIASYNGMH